MRSGRPSNKARSDANRQRMNARFQDIMRTQTLLRLYVPLEEFPNLDILHQAIEESFTPLDQRHLQRIQDQLFVLRPDLPALPGCVLPYVEQPILVEHHAEVVELNELHEQCEELRATARNLTIPEYFEVTPMCSAEVGIREVEFQQVAEACLQRISSEPSTASLGPTTEELVVWKYEQLLLSRVDARTLELADKVSPQHVYFKKHSEIRLAMMNWHLPGQVLRAEMSMRADRTNGVSFLDLLHLHVGSQQFGTHYALWSVLNKLTKIFKLPGPPGLFKFRGPPTSLRATAARRLMEQHIKLPTRCKRCRERLKIIWTWTNDAEWILH